MSIEVSDTRVKKDKAVSCAECRRLKLKCDRIFPCSTCRRRGLAALCPHASLPTRQRKQQAAAADSNVPCSQFEQAARIRELEDALRSVHAMHSNQPHPLLLDDRNATSHTPLSRPPAPTRAMSEDSDSPSPGGGVGTQDASLDALTVEFEVGKSGYRGLCGEMASFYNKHVNKRTTEGPSLQPEWSSGPFRRRKDHALDSLYPKASRDAIIQHLEDYLPDAARAWELCDLYYHKAGWMYSAISRPQFVEEILQPVYNTLPPSFGRTPTAHLNATILFMVFAVGSLMDPGTPPDPGEDIPYPQPSWAGRSASGKDQDPESTHSQGSDSQWYHRLARIALSAGTSIMEDPTIPAVRAVFLMAIYHSQIDRKHTPQYIWSLLSIAVALGSSLGLHRDCGKWKLDPPMIEQRRELFWEMNFFVSLEVSLAWGRPPPIALPFIDCELNSDTDQKRGVNGEIQHGFRHRLRTIGATILKEIRDIILGTKPTKYTDILALDRKLRECAVELFGGPVGCRKLGPEFLKDPASTTTMEALFLLILKEIMMMYLHRKYFVRACTLPTQDLPKSRYCASLLTAFRSAEAFIVLMEWFVDVDASIPRRLGCCWSHVLASSIVVGSIAIRHPRWALAVEATQALDLIWQQLRKVACTSDQLDRPLKALKFVSHLRERAYRAASQPEACLTAPHLATPGPTDELSVLAGHGRVFSTKPQLYHGSSITPSRGNVHPPLPEDFVGTNERNGDEPSYSSMSTTFNPGHPIPGDLFVGDHGMNSETNNSVHFKSFAFVDKGITERVPEYDQFDVMSANPPGGQDWGTVNTDTWQGVMGTTLKYF